MKPQVNVIALVDVIGALSDRTLHNGNLSLVDDGDFRSHGQGTPELCTIVLPGQLVQWTVLAVDLQTPVEIKGITFSGGRPPAGIGGTAGDDGPGPSESSVPVAGAAPYPDPAAVPGLGLVPAAGGQPDPDGLAADSGKLDLNVWLGAAPPWLIPGWTYQYRLELQVYEGEFSTMHIDTAALMCL